MANDPLTPEGLLAGVLRLRAQRVERERDAAIGLLRRLVEEYDEWRAICNICGMEKDDHSDAVWSGHDFHLSPRVVNQRIVAAARPLLAAIDGAAPAERGQ